MHYSEVEESTLKFYLSYGERGKKQDQNRGKSDGNRLLPSADSSDYPFRYEVLAHAKTALADYGTNLAEHIKRLELRISNGERERDENYGKKRSGLVEKYQSSLRELDKIKGEQSPKYRYLEERLKGAEERLRDIEFSVQRPLRVSFLWFYVPILAILVFVEVPVNRLAFELFFLEAPIISLFLAVVLGFIIMLCAHFAGLWMRQAYHYPKKSEKIFHYFGVLVIVIVIGVMIYFVAAIRQRYVDLLEQDAGSDFGNLLQSGASGVQIFSGEALSAGLGTAGVTLLMINILIFLVGAIASFVRHDPHPDYEGATRTRDKLAKRLRKVQERFEKSRAEAVEDHERRIAYLDNKLDQTEREIQVARHELKMVQDRRPKIVEMMSGIITTRLLAYQYGNQLARGGNDVPACIRTSPNVDDIMSELNAS